MDKKRKLLFRVCGYLFTAILILFLLIVKEKKGEKVPSYEKEITFPVMGTIAHFKIQGERGMPLARVEKTLYAMQDVVRTLEKECNIYDPASPLSQLNREAHKKPFPLSGHLWFLLQESRKFYTFSEGSFDITISPLMRVWGFHRKRDTFPGREEIREAKKMVGLHKLIFDEKKKTVLFPVPGFKLDLGGIAKGYALDLARQKAEEMGICRGVLDLGGNILTLPLPYYGKESYSIGIRDPRKKGEILTVIEMPPGKCIAGSGSYERFRVIQGKRVSHIIDPLTGMPASSASLSATVITEKGIDSDALSTILFLQGEKGMTGIEKAFPGTSLLYFRQDSRGKMQGFYRGKTFEKAVQGDF